MSMLPSIACTQLQVVTCLVADQSPGSEVVGAEVSERGHGLARAHVGPDDPARLVDGSEAFIRTFSQNEAGSLGMSTQLPSVSNAHPW